MSAVVIDPILDTCYRYGHSCIAVFTLPCSTIVKPVAIWLQVLVNVVCTTSHTHTHTHTSPHPLELMYCPKYSIGHLSTLLSTWLSCCLPVIVHVCAIPTQDELESSLQIGNLQTMEVALLYAMVLPWDFNGVCASWIETMKLHMTWKNTLSKGSKLVT